MSSAMDAMTGETLLCVWLQGCNNNKRKSMSMVRLSVKPKFEYSLPLSGNHGEFLKVRFHTYCHTMIVLRHLNNLLASYKHTLDTFYRID